MSKLETRSAFHDVAAPGRYGRPDGDAGVIVSEREGLGLVTLEGRKGAQARLLKAIQNAYGVEAPDGPTVASGRDVRFIGTGPGQWLAVSETMQNEALTDDLVGKLEGLASIVDQSSGRATLRIEGPNARDCLAKGFAIDLDPRVFPDGSAATGAISLMGALVWRDGEAYDVVVFRSVAASFWHWLEASAAEYGCEIVTTS